MRIRPHPISEFCLFAYPNNIQDVQPQQQRRVQGRPHSARPDAPSAGCGGRYRGDCGYGQAPPQSRRTSNERTTGHANARERRCPSYGGQRVPPTRTGHATASGDPLPLGGSRVAHRATRHAKRTGRLQRCEVRNPGSLTNIEAYFTQLGFYNERYIELSKLLVGANCRCIKPDGRPRRLGGESFEQSGRR